MDPVTVAVTLVTSALSLASKAIAAAETAAAGTDSAAIDSMKAEHADLLSQLVALDAARTAARAAIDGELAAMVPPPVVPPPPTVPSPAVVAAPVAAPVAAGGEAHPAAVQETLK